MCVSVSAIRRPRVVLVHVRECTYMWLTSACTRAPTLTVTFNVDDHFHLEMIVNINVILERVLADSTEKRSRQSSEDIFHDEIVQEIKKQLGPSYNSLSMSLYSDSLCLLIIKLISPILKVVDEKKTILIMILFLFSNMLRLFSCLSCFDIPLLPFI